MQAPILFSDLIAETKDGEWGEGQEAPGHVLCDVIRGTDFASLNAPSLELPQRWVPEHLVVRKALEADDILIETAGGTAKQSTGRTALVTKEFLASRGDRPVLCSSFARHLRVDRDKVQPVYLYYVLQALYVSGYMGVFNLQHTGVARFQFTAFRTKTRLALHEKAAQPKIAATLKSYDDLIANNQRRIALLESMAEEIYREWFVRMRFPGYATAAHERGMPLGWQASTATEMVQVLGGGTPSTEVSQYWGGDIPFFSPKDSHDGAYCLQTEQSITELGLENCASRRFPKDTIFITARGTVGNLVLAGEPMAMNQSCYALVPKIDKKPYFVFAGLRCAVNVIKGVSNSGVFDNVVMDTFKIIPLINPGFALRDRYNEVAEPIFEQSLMLRRANTRLRATRDALLPRLISGKLRVDALDIQFPPSMQPPPAEAAPREAINS
ncbi:restriction endonuclease subunit S [Roseateles amylovorans]|uniref:Restriction endonuclease subunit S n=1 Tax=Roseateles amylovorans TaxID=2978473 RepID=A0ABY6B252_9BURK|nr:restriction endonuclease subunit S [Roseateles amylovorans]UXH78291.1 restriction endonuclease subunit S [Roseateles amylovorans]